MLPCANEITLPHCSQIAIMNHCLVKTFSCRSNTHEPYTQQHSFRLHSNLLWIVSLPATSTMTGDRRVKGSTRDWTGSGGKFLPRSKKQFCWTHSSTNQWFCSPTSITGSQKHTPKNLLQVKDVNTTLKRQSRLTPGASFSLNEKLASWKSRSHVGCACGNMAPTARLRMRATCSKRSGKVNERATSRASSSPIGVFVLRMPRNCNILTF